MSTFFQVKLGDDDELQKSEAIGLEWQYLLTAHLETQKRSLLLVICLMVLNLSIILNSYFVRFFEEKITEIEVRNERKIKYLEEEFAGLLAEVLPSPFLAPLCFGYLLFNIYIYDILIYRKWTLLRNCNILSGKRESWKRRRAIWRRK